MWFEYLLPFLLVVTGLLAALAGLWAARAAHRSATAAYEAAKHAETVDRRGVLRDVIATCHRLHAETVQIAAAIESLKSEYRILAEMTGQSGGSREKYLVQKADSTHRELLALQAEAQRQIEERARLLNASDEEIMHALTKFDGYLIQALRTKENVERELASAAGDNRFYREGRIKSLHQRT